MAVFEGCVDSDTTDLSATPVNRQTGYTVVVFYSEYCLLGGLCCRSVCGCAFVRHCMCVCVCVHVHMWINPACVLSWCHEVLFHLV